MLNSPFQLDTMKNTWVRFKKNGAAYGYAYFAGDVAEIASDKADALLEQGVVVAAKESEIPGKKV